MRRLLAGLGGLVLVCSVLVGAARVISRRDPPEAVAVLLPDDGCRAPCWQGLRPGTIDDDTFDQWFATRPAEWRVRLIQAAPASERWRMDVDTGSIDLIIDRQNLSTADRIRLIPDDLAVGDLIAALGEPDYVMVTAGRSPALVGFQFYYEAEHLIVDGVLPYPDRGYVLRVDHPISQLRYEAVPWGRSVVAFDWTGLGTLDRYFQGMMP